MFTILLENQTPGGGLMQMLPMLLIMFGIIYFLLIRPQQKERKAHEAMLANLQKNDKVLTQGGILGTVAAIEQDGAWVSLKVDDNVRLKVSRAAISRKIESTTE